MLSEQYRDGDTGIIVAEEDDGARILTDGCDAGDRPLDDDDQIWLDGDRHAVEWADGLYRFERIETRHHDESLKSFQLDVATVRRWLSDDSVRFRTVSEESKLDVGDRC